MFAEKLVEMLADTLGEAKAERLSYTLSDVEMATRCKERGIARYIG